MGIKTFANCLEELQINLIEKDGYQCISEEVKRRKFLNHLPDYMETTLVPQILDSWTFNDLVKKAESHQAARKHGRTITTPKPARQPTTQPPPNPSRNHRRDRKTDNKKTSSNPGRTLAMKTTTTKDPDWVVVNKTLTSQDKMKLIRERKCLWCRVPGHTFKQCKNRISKIPMRTTAQVLSLQHTTKPVIAKNNYKSKTKAKPQSTEELDYSRVRVKVNGHPAHQPKKILASLKLHGRFMGACFWSFRSSREAQIAKQLDMKLKLQNCLEWSSWSWIAKLIFGWCISPCRFTDDWRRPHHRTIRTPLWPTHLWNR